MILNNLELINTELGRIPVIVNEIIEDDMITYQGRMIDNDMVINIQTPTKESCLEGLKNGFELQMHFWLYNELLPLDIDFDK